MSDSNPLDATDYALVEMLQKDGRLKLKELREGLIQSKLTLGLTTVHERVEALKKNGFIQIRAVPDYRKIGLPSTHFVQVKLSKVSGKTLEQTAIQFEEAIRVGFDSVLEVYRLKNKWDYMLKIITRDGEHFDKVSSDLRNLEPVGDTLTISATGLISKSVKLNY